jgi:glucosyl-3-phosphoglycerate phosphatase
MSGNGLVELLVIRHGQSEWNALGRGHGWGDPPLSALGESQAAAAVPALARAGLQPGVAASDLRRARRTAELVAGPLGLDPVTTVAELREHDIGEWDGRTWAEIEADRPGAMAAWVAEQIEQPPGGETRTAFHERVLAGITRVAGDRSGGRTLVVAHGGVVRACERLAGVEPHPIDFLSGRWFAFRDGRLKALDAFQAEPPSGRDFQVP